jgi:hypothetical protein
MFPLDGAEVLRVPHPQKLYVLGQDDGRGHDRSGKRAAADFVNPGNPLITPVQSFPFKMKKIHPRGEL